MLRGFLIGAGAVMFAALPATNNYQLRDYGFGNGSGTSTSDSYSVQGIAGELSYGQTGTNTYGLTPGLLGSQLSALPGAPTWQNLSDWYNRLQIIIDTSGNPDDTVYAVAISDDNFATTSYVQADNTVGSALGLEDFRSYTDWGEASGVNVIGLKPDTTYQVKVKARQGEFSETGYGPVATAATSQVAISFDIDIASNDIESAPPYTLDFGNVLPDTITDSPNLIWLDLDSNADSGAYVYIVSNNQGLLSATTGYTIDSVTGDLNANDEGIGAQNNSATQAGGGPLTANSPYDGASSNVGVIDTEFRPLMSASGPLDSGRASFILKIKTSGTTPAASDYADIYTLIATAAF